MGNRGSASVSLDGVMGGKGNKARIIVSPETIAQLGAGDEPKVDVEVNGYRYRSVVRFQHGVHFVSHTIADRKVTGLAVGDPIAVTLSLAAD
jgi:hypothetical protein